jgi:hypothetical protein
VVRQAFIGLPVTMPRYYYRRPRDRRARHPRLELIATALVVVLLIALLVTFLVIYHDFPLRVSGQ